MPTTELIIPPRAESDPKSVEIARIWVAHKQQHVSLRTEQWAKTLEAWGIMLCDLAHHVANAYEEQGVGKHVDIFASIVSMFNDEAGEPTDKPSGGMVPEH